MLLLAETMLSWLVRLTTSGYPQITGQYLPSTPTTLGEVTGVSPAHDGTILALFFHAGEESMDTFTHISYMDHVWDIRF